MGKVDLLVKCCLKKIKNEYNIKGILTENKIKFILEDTNMIIDIKNNTLERDTKDLKIFFEFNLLRCLIFDKINNKKFTLEINLIELKNKKIIFMLNIKSIMMNLK